MFSRVRNAVALVGGPRVLIICVALVALFVSARVTSGATAASKPITRHIAATPIAIRSNPPGAPTTTGIQYISVAAGSAAQNGGSAHGTAVCPVGYSAISGGFSSLGSNIAVSENAPNPDHTSWSVAIQNNDYSPEWFNVYAVCAGSSGPQGADAISNPQYISASGGIAAANGGDAHMTVSCPAGTNAISGGFSSLGSNIAVSEDAPNPDHISWTVEIQNNDHSAAALNVYVVCANVG